MAENKWVSLGLFHPTNMGYFTPFITGSRAHLVGLPLITKQDTDELLQRCAHCGWGLLAAQVLSEFVTLGNASA